ncbi:hypothetical protein D1007_60690 [Hordeum vulgare]|nr:hypothetical protein D1007_60690 [Hordeum vulgare]
MNFESSSNEEYGPTKLDKIAEAELFDSSDSQKELDMTMLVSMQEEMNRKVKHIMNFKGSIKERGVINLDRVSKARLLHNDYFALDPIFSGDL